MFDKQPPTLRRGLKVTGEATQKRPDKETHITKRPDRVGPYLKDHLDEFTFSEFGSDYLKRNGMKESFTGVPIPLRDEDRKATGGPEGLKGGIVAENMARVLGIDTNFKYRDIYVDYINLYFGNKAVDNMANKAKDYGEKGDKVAACIYFRAALVLKYNDLSSMYGYARALREMYSDADGKKEDYVGNLKAEALDYLELTTEIYPNFDMAWYYLGYMYLNLGLYIKAKLAWNEYLKFGRVRKDRTEIKKRIEQLKEPVEIEKGYNAVLSGRWNKGLDILEPYKDSRFNDWWPLWYYLGVAYARTGRLEEAEGAFKRALKGSPRHLESMEELISIYEANGDKKNIKKYQDKIKLVYQES